MKPDQLLIFQLLYLQIQDFPGMLNFYHISVIQFFKSNWPEVRAGAAMFIGETDHIVNIRFHKLQVTTFKMPYFIMSVLSGS